MVVQTRSQTKVLREILSDRDFCNMFRSLNFRRRIGRRAAEQALEEADAIIKEEESDSDYDPVIDNIDSNHQHDVNWPHFVAQSPAIPAIEAPPAANQTLRISMEKFISWLQLLFYSLGIVIFLYIMYKFMFPDDNDGIEAIIVKRNSNWFSSYFQPK